MLLHALLVVVANAAPIAAPLDDPASATEHLWLTSPSGRQIARITGDRIDVLSRAGVVRRTLTMPSPTASPPPTTTMNASAASAWETGGFLDEHRLMLGSPSAVGIIDVDSGAVACTMPLALGGWLRVGADVGVVLEPTTDAPAQHNGKAAMVTVVDGACQRGTMLARGPIVGIDVERRRGVVHLQLSEDHAVTRVDTMDIATGKALLTTTRGQPTPTRAEALPGFGPPRWARTLDAEVLKSGATLLPSARHDDAGVVVSALLTTSPSAVRVQARRVRGGRAFAPVPLPADVDLDQLALLDDSTLFVPLQGSEKFNVAKLP